MVSTLYPIIAAISLLVVIFIVERVKKTARHNRANEGYQLIFLGWVMLFCTLDCSLGIFECFPNTHLHEMNREIARDILEDYGMIVDEAEDGDIAVTMLGKIVEDNNPLYYDFVLMDIQMPRMNGFEATKLIRCMPGTEEYHLPIIAMTANAFDEDKKKSFEAGMDAHLAKPIKVDLLLSTLNNILSRKEGF